MNKQEYAETGEKFDLHRLCIKLAFDCVAYAAFGYDLGAVRGSEDGQKLYKCVVTLAEDAASKG
jgi:hypothetical protein